MLVLIFMLWYPIRLTWDAKLILHRLAMFWNLPFTLYYYTGEWQALINVTLLMILFFPLGMLMHWAEVYPS